MKNAFHSLLFGCLLLILGCADENQFVKQHSDIKSHCAEIKHIAVLPANTSVFQVSFGGKQALSDKMQEVSKNLLG